MNNVAIQRHSRPLHFDLAELFDSLPALAALRPLFDTRAIRLEDEEHDDIYEIRAELPGVDPEDDIEVTVHDGKLTITAERPRPGEHCGRTEFGYGSFRRTVTLPDGADPDRVSATYDRGILTVTVALSDDHRVGKHIEVLEIVGVEYDDAEDDPDDEDHDHPDDEGHDNAHGAAENGSEQPEHAHQG